MITSIESLKQILVQLKKRLGIVLYYWPPAGGPGVQRWLYFVKYLANEGYDLVLFLPKNPHYPIKDESLVADVVEGIQIERIDFFEPYALGKIFFKSKVNQISSGIVPEKRQTWLERLLLQIRGNFFIPDARKYWRRPAYKRIAKVHRRKPLDIIITTGPPHSVHLIGLDVRNKFRIPWIADFRDPWTNIGYHDKLHLSTFAAKKHLELEQKVLTRADRIVVTSYETKKEFSAKTDRPIHLITNGFEPKPEVNTAIEPTFTLVHIGSLLSGRNPHILWEVLWELCEENAKFRKDLKVRCIGLSSQEVHKSVVDNMLADVVSFEPYMSHDAVLQEQRRSAVLLLLEINRVKTKGIIPGKLFEYMAAKRPILALGPKGWDVTKILNVDGNVCCFHPKEKEQLKNYIRTLYQNYKDGILVAPNYNISAYTRESLTKKVIEIIEQTNGDSSQTID